MKILRTVLPLAAAFMLTAAAAAPEDTALKTAIADSARTKTFVDRDKYRHPYESLKFWGLKAQQRVVEINPGGGYWSEILAPYAKATGGSYVATVADVTKVNEQQAKNIAAFQGRFADESKYGKVSWQTWSAASGTLGAPGSADLVITARNIHNWMTTPGQLDNVIKEAHAVLKPGGILAVEEHRADPRAQVPEARDGYVSTASVVEAVQKAGFKLEESSEVNANPKDTKDHTNGVWTLPPTNMNKAGARPQPGSAPLKAPEAYQAIGESDRMTLRFRKL